MRRDLQEMIELLDRMAARTSRAKLRAQERPLRRLEDAALEDFRVVQGAILTLLALIVLAVPLVTFVLAQSIHGNGFLAAFIAGLLANYNHNNHAFQKTLHTMEIKIESISKPMIFMMVGPFVSLGDLADTAVMGLIVSILFMVIARPVAVMVSLLPTNMNMKEKLFMTAVRETGVIPVVLAVITVAQFPELTLLMPLTAWVVIWTLTILPAITPWWSRKLQIVE